MKTLIKLFYKLTLHDFNSKLESAKKTSQMIMASTEARTNHFYNEQGVKIRGWQSRNYKFTNNIHPLIAKYN
jgi:predicted secreted protein